MGTTITIPGLSKTTKSPGFKGAVSLGTGALNQGGLLRRLLVVGNKTSDGSLTADTELLRVQSEDKVDEICGPGSELALGAYKALLYESVEVWVGAVAEAGGAAAAGATITFTGTSTAAGTLYVRIGGYKIEYSYASGVAASAAATALAAKINAATRCAVTAAADTADVDLTTKSKSARMNNLAVYIDQTDMGAGLTAAVTGGSALPSKGAQTGCRFTGGSGADSAANLITILKNENFDTVAVPHVDATNMGRWKDHFADIAQVGKQKHQAYVAGQNLTYSTAQSISYTTLNDGYGQVVHIEDCENLGSEIAASAAGLRQLKDSEHPNQSFYGEVLLGIAPLVNSSSNPTDSEIETSLTNGLTPCITQNGEVVMIESITTLCHDGDDNFDGRCWRTGEARTAFRTFEGIGLIYTSEFAVENPWVGPDLPDGKSPPEGKATPSLWKSRITAYLREKEAEFWIIDVDNNLPSVTYDTTFKGLLAQLNLEVHPVQNKTGVWVRQQASS